MRLVFKIMKILMSGANGLLGIELKKIEPSIISLSRTEMDVCNYDQIMNTVDALTIVEY